MFVTAQLKPLSEFVDESVLSVKTQNILELYYLNLEATLLRAKVLREFSKTQSYSIIQSKILPEQASLAYLFAPFILSNLNKTVLYATPASSVVMNVLNHYYQADQKYSSEQKQNSNPNKVLDALNIFLDIQNLVLSDSDFIYLNLIKALCRADVSTIFLITDLKLDLKKVLEIESFFNVRILQIRTHAEQYIPDSSTLNINHLLFKNKNAFYTDLCSQFSHINAQLLQHCDQYRFDQAQHLIEDMFYSEHIIEKLSVYSEYMQTCLQQEKAVFI
ncbi:MAG: hypothetical protein RR569_02970 [Acinetobacter sp.]